MIYYLQNVYYLQKKNFCLVEGNFDSKSMDHVAGESTEFLACSNGISS